MAAASGASPAHGLNTLTRPQLLLSSCERCRASPRGEGEQGCEEGEDEEAARQQLHGALGSRVWSGRGGLGFKVCRGAEGARLIPAMWVTSRTQAGPGLSGSIPQQR